MILPLNFDDLSILLAITAVILLVTSELLSSFYRRILINKRKLRRAAIAFSIFFLVTVAIKIANIIFSSL